MSKKKRQETPNRYREVRDDASIAATQRAIAKTMGLPIDSVKLVLPGGRKARADAKVESLRKRHNGG